MRILDWARETGAHWWALAAAGLGGLALLKPAALLHPVITAVRRLAELRAQASISRMRELLDQQVAKTLERYEADLRECRDGHRQCREELDALKAEVTALKAALADLRRLCPNCPNLDPGVGP